MGVFKQIVSESAVQIDEAFNQEPYEYSTGKKGAEVFSEFEEEEGGKTFRIRFRTPEGMGKNVRRVVIDERAGTATFKKIVTKFKNPLKVITTLVAATEEFLMTPIGMKVDGLAIFIPAIAGARVDDFLKLLFKRNPKLRSKLQLLDSKFQLEERGYYLWAVRKGKNPAEVFNGEKVAGMFPDEKPVADTDPVVAPAPTSNTAPDTKPRLSEWRIEAALLRAMESRYTLSKIDIVTREDVWGRTYSFSAKEGSDVLTFRFNEDLADATKNDFLIIKNGVAAVKHRVNLNGLDIDGLVDIMKSHVDAYFWASASKNVDPVVAPAPTPTGSAATGVPTPQPKGDRPANADMTTLFSKAVVAIEALSFVTQSDYEQFEKGAVTMLTSYEDTYIEVIERGEKVMVQVLNEDDSLYTIRGSDPRLLAQELEEWVAQAFGR